MSLKIITAQTESILLYHELIDELTLMEITEVNNMLFFEITFSDGQQLNSQTTSLLKWVKNGWHVIGEL